MIESVTRNECNFSDVFYFAEKNFGLSWNTCNDLFFTEGILDYERFNNFYLQDIERGLAPDSKYPYEGEERQAYEVLAAFMKANDVEIVRVYND